MGLFSKKTPELQTEHRGGCSVHDMRGPARSKVKDATKDVHEHGKRMHGSADFSGGYIERRR